MPCCSKCGAQIGEGSPFCSKCGAKVGEPIATQPAASGTKSCPKCGTAMTLRLERQDVGKFLGAVGCLGCLVAPIGCLLAPLAFFLPKKNYYVCPKCGTKLAAQ